MAQGIAAFSLLVLLTLAPVVGAFAAQDATQRGTSDQQRACSRDVSRYCRHVMNDGDEVIFGCLREHHTKLSKACRKIIDTSGR